MKNYLTWFVVSALGVFLGFVLARSLIRDKEPNCHYCGIGDAHTTDYIIPLRLGGTEAVPCCANCNMSKGSQVPRCFCDDCQGILRRWLAKAKSLSATDTVWKNRLDEFWNGSIKENV